MGWTTQTLLGPIVIDGTLTEEKYLELLQTEISERLAAVDTGAELWRMHDGCPAHQYSPAKEFLHNAFPNRVIGRGEVPVA